MKTKIRGFEMAYDDSGSSGVPLVLIQSFPHDRTIWSAQISGLKDRARVIAPDLRGFGESSLPQSPARAGESAQTQVVTIDTYAEDVRGLLDALGIKNAVIAGMSMGGYIAFAFYRAYAHRVRGLILVDTRAGADSPEAKKGREYNAALVRAQGAGTIAEKMLPKMLTPQTLESNAEKKNALVAMMARQSVEGIASALLAMRDRADSTPTLAQISVPTLIIFGADDALIPVKEGELLRDQIHGAKLATIPNAAHLPCYEQSDAFNRAVREFLKSDARLVE